MSTPGQYPVIPIPSRTTSAEAALLRVLQQQHGFRAAAEVRDAATADGRYLSMVTVHCLLDGLVRRGEVDVVHGRRGDARFRVRRPADHYRHLLCRGCDQVIEVGGDELSWWINDLARIQGLGGGAVRPVEIGTCDGCVNALPIPARWHDRSVGV